TDQQAPQAGFPASCVCVSDDKEPPKTFDSVQLTSFLLKDRCALPDQMSFGFTFSRRRFILAMRDGDIANKNKIAVFDFGVTPKHFPEDMLLFDYLPPDVAGFLEPMAERGDVRRIPLRRCAVEKSDQRRWLLPARRERPCRRAAEKRDELAPVLIELHAIL